MISFRTGWRKILQYHQDVHHHHYNYHRNPALLPTSSPKEIFTVYHPIGNLVLYILLVSWSELTFVLSQYFNVQTFFYYRFCFTKHDEKERGYWQKARKEEVLFSEKETSDLYYSGIEECCYERKGFTG